MALRVIGINHKLGTWTDKNGQEHPFGYTLVTYNQEDEEAPFGFVKVSKRVFESWDITPDQMVGVTLRVNPEKDVQFMFYYDQYRNVCDYKMIQ